MYLFKVLFVYFQGGIKMKFATKMKSAVSGVMAAAMMLTATGAMPYANNNAAEAAGAASFDKDDFFVDHAAENVSAAIDRIAEGKEP